MKSDKLLDPPELNSSLMAVLGLRQRPNSTIMMGIFALHSDIAENAIAPLTRTSCLMDATLNIQVHEITNARNDLILSD